MAKDLSKINKKLAEAAGSINPTDEQMAQFAKMVSKYKNKSLEEIEAEINQMMGNFSRAQKDDFIQKLQMLKQIQGLLDRNQMKKVDLFIRLLSQ